MTRKQLSQILLSAGLCTSLLLACTKKENADAEKAELSAATDAQKAEQQKYESLNAQLEKQKAAQEKRATELETLKKELDDLAELRAAERYAHELELNGLSVRIEKATKELSSTNLTLETTKEILTKRSAELEALNTDIASQRSSLAQQIKDTEAQIEKLQEEADAAIAADRAEHRAKMDAEIEQLNKDLNDLHSRLDAVAEREEKAKAEEAVLAQTRTDLEALQTQLNTDKAAHDEAVAVFAEKVAAARDFFVKEGKGDVFEKIEANSTFTFRFSLWGFGSVENIQSIQSKISQYNTQNGLKKDNDNKRYYPHLIKADKRKVLDQESLNEAAKVAYVKVLESVLDLAESDFYYSTVKDVTFVNDSYLVTGTATDIKNFRDQLNNELAKIGESNPNSANMWVMARPVQEVMVNMTISLKGSDDLGHNRSMENIISSNRIRPKKSTIKTLKDLDQLNPSQYVIDEKTSATCETITGECLKALKDAGLLDKKLIVSSILGSEESDKTIGQAIEGAIASSIMKLRLENRIKARLEGGFAVSGTGRYVEKSIFDPTRWFGSKYTTEIDWDDNSEAMKELLEDEEAFNQLAATLVLEKIEIGYEISMVDKVNGANDSIDMAQYLTVAQIGDSSLMEAGALERGVVEIPLPIKSKQSSTSNFVDLTLDGYLGGLTAPAPFTMEEPKAVDQHAVDFIMLHPMVKLDIQEAVANGETYSVDHLEGDQVGLAQRYIEHVKYIVKLDEYRDAQRRHREAVEKYQADLEKAKQREYSIKSIDHRRDLEKMLEKMTGMSFEEFLKKSSEENN